jgi:hypothetical protein
VVQPPYFLWKEGHVKEPKLKYEVRLGEIEMLSAEVWADDGRLKKGDLISIIDGDREIRMTVTDIKNDGVYSSAKLKEVQD